MYESRFSSALARGSRFSASFSDEIRKNYQHKKTYENDFESRKARRSKISQRSGTLPHFFRRMADVLGWGCF